MIIQSYTHPDAPSLTTKIAKLEHDDCYMGFSGRGCVRVDIDSAMTVIDEYDAEMFEVIADKLTANGWIEA